MLEIEFMEAPQLYGVIDERVLALEERRALKHSKEPFGMPI